jgi:hypothetical protein
MQDRVNQVLLELAVEQPLSEQEAEPDRSGNQVAGEAGILQRIDFVPSRRALKNGEPMIAPRGTTSVSRS